jgi:hypothetical protein
VSAVFSDVMDRNKLKDCILKLLFKLKSENISTYLVLSVRGREVVIPE